MELLLIYQINLPLLFKLLVLELIQLMVLLQKILISGMITIKINKMFLKIYIIYIKLLLFILETNDLKSSFIL